MKATERSHPAGFVVLEIESGDDRLELSTFGGQLLAWERAGEPILFANRDHAVIDGKTPYRGGAPICFPYFGKGALLPGAPALSPQHGQARTSIWDWEAGSGEIRLWTRQDPFSCELAYRFENGVSIEARIANQGAEAAPVQLAIHSYWAAERPDLARVRGLGAAFLDNLAGYAAAADEAPGEPHTPPFDRVYPDASADLAIETEAWNLNIHTQGCAGAVLWNPGEGHSIADLGEPRFICVENGLIYPSRELVPGEEHVLAIDFRLRLN